MAKKVSAHPGVSLSTANFPDRAFLNELCRIFDAERGTVLPKASFAKVSTLNLSEHDIKSLTGLAYFTGLKELYCSGNQLRSLDVRCCPALKTLSCEHNRLEHLYIDGCAALYTVVCSNNYLHRLNLAGCASLHELLCEGNLLTGLKTADAPALELLWCDHSKTVAPPPRKNIVHTRYSRRVSLCLLNTARNKYSSACIDI